MHRQSLSPKWNIAIYVGSLIILAILVLGGVFRYITGTLLFLFQTLTFLAEYVKNKRHKFLYMSGAGIIMLLFAGIVFLNIFLLGSPSIRRILSALMLAWFSYYCFKKGLDFKKGL